MAKQAKANRKPKRAASSKVSGKRKKAARGGVKKAAVKKAPARSGSSRTKSTKAALRTAARKNSASSASGKRKKAVKAAIVTTAKKKAVKEKATGKKAPLASSKVSSKTDQVDARPPPVEVKPLPKTHLTPAQLEEFRLLLLEKRAELAGAVTHLTSDMTNPKSHGPSEHASMPIHMADVGSDNWEKEFTLGLIESEHERIREIDDALARIEDETYGKCLATHRRISRARLRAKPWAKYCIEYARAREEGRTL